jgi:hypothetical protein
MQLKSHNKHCNASHHSHDTTTRVKTFTAALTTNNMTRDADTGAMPAGDTNAHMDMIAPTGMHEQTQTKMQTQTKQTPHTTESHPCPTTLASTAEK